MLNRRDKLDPNGL